MKETATDRWRRKNGMNATRTALLEDDGEQLIGMYSHHGSKKYDMRWCMSTTYLQYVYGAKKYRRRKD